MGTVHPVYHHQHQHQHGDQMQAFDGYAPAPDMNALALGTPGITPYGMLPETNWGQWWSAGDAAFAETANVAAPNIFDRDQQLLNNDNYTLDQDTSAQWDSPSTSTHSYPVPSPSTEATSLDMSPGHDNSRRGSSSTQPDQRKRKRSTATSTKSKPQPPARKPTRRTSTKKTSKAESVAATEKPKRGRKSKASAKQKQSAQEEFEEEDEDAEFDPEEEYDTHNKKIQERNRIASNKFRVKKREDAIKLRADEEDMERSNRNLSNCVSDLTLQVYELKMKLLQHTDCDCTLIQEYIATEAQRYIKDLGDGKHPNSTPPIPPFYQHHHR
jgi:hypothetical protein